MNVTRFLLALTLALATLLAPPSFGARASTGNPAAGSPSAYIPSLDDDDDDVDEDDFDDGFDDDDASGSSGSAPAGDSSGRGSAVTDDDDDSGQGRGRGRGRGGNDDFALEIEVDDVDGVSVPVVDIDDDDATDGFRALQAIVRLQPGTSITGFNAKHGTTTVAAYVSRDLYLLQLPADRRELEVERELALDPDTRWTELNFVAQAPEGRPGYFFVSGSPGAPGVNAESSTATLVNHVQAQTCGTGSGVKVAVLDTGIDPDHPLLAGKIADGGWNALADSPDVADIGNGKDDDDDVLVDEMVGHGTHVAGIIATVAPGATILPVKVLNSDGVGDAFFIAAGIHYAVDQRAQVINLSLGSTYDSRVIAEAVAEAAEAGVVVVAAAGNGGTNRPIEFPAANTGVIAVAATDQNDLKTSFSNYGEQIDLAAPGADILSALPGGDVGTWSGTSMAAPFVAATAALVAEAHPSWSSPQITRRLSRTSADLDAVNPDFAGQLGAGRLDAAAAIRCDSAEAASTAP